MSDFKQMFFAVIFLLTIIGISSRSTSAECTGDGSAKFKQAVESLQCKRRSS